MIKFPPLYSRELTQRELTALFGTMRKQELADYLTEYNKTARFPVFFTIRKSTKCVIIQSRDLCPHWTYYLTHYNTLQKHALPFVSK